jgi:hypothetical protein
VLAEAAVRGARERAVCAPWSLRTRNAALADGLSAADTPALVDAADEWLAVDEVPASVLYM